MEGKLNIYRKNFFSYLGDELCRCSPLLHPWNGAIHLYKS